MSQNILFSFLFVTIASGSMFGMELDSELKSDISPRSNVFSSHRDIHSVGQPSDVVSPSLSQDEVTRKVLAIIEEFRSSMRASAIASLRIKDNEQGDLGLVIMTESHFAKIQNDLFFMNARIGSLESYIIDNALSK